MSAPVAPRVSLITPTRGRSAFLAATARNVLAQTYRDFEWLVLDDSDAPDEHMLRLADPRVRYQHVPPRLSIGAKRNRLAAAATGEYVVHIDDDDYYAPGYVAAMVGRMQADRADIAHLCAWYLQDARHDFFGYWDLRLLVGPHYLCHLEGVRMAHFSDANNASLRDNYLGYGFTYAYRRAVWEAGPFPDQDWGEDAVFMKAAARFRLATLEDRGALVLHVLHAASSSSCAPQYRLPAFLRSALFPGYKPVTP